ncbi:S1-C subfamily serine protease [Stella humosa]|uniref:S1-C subfamily serine protease n=1 Tax=Stella humosa TaxID=94 RepID=A0A3N1KY28_9PROT|nr:S1C family serine protease [Stella humosa]ROP83490.1 S1-C subfamily serine protease [Stella humosa]BBK33237.1 serine protease [Stella humosa]
MSTETEWNVPEPLQPRPEDHAYDLERALSSVVGLKALVPSDAFTAETLGTERAGNGVIIRGDGLVLTVGYLVAEAETVYLTLSDGRAVPGHVVAYDHETGLGLVQALARIDLPALPLGRAAAAEVGERVVVGGAGGRSRSVSARIVARQEFAGYWEYVLDEAIFTSPAHPNWGGAPLINAAGELIGIGSLQLQQGRGTFLNMIIPIDVLKPVFEDLQLLGRPNRPPRPWLGLYAAEVEEKVAVVGLSDGGPAAAAGIQTGDILLAVAGVEPGDLAGFYRRVWEQGPAGALVPLTINRDGRTLEIVVKSSDRSRFLKKPSLH